MKKVEIFTDGACSGNPGPGGWGAILRYNGVEKELSGGDPLTTNNRMEMLAVIEALKALKEPCEVTVTSDSQYVCNGINKGWAVNWQKNNWIKSDKTKAKGLLGVLRFAVDDIGDGLSKAKDTAKNFLTNSIEIQK